MTPKTNIKPEKKSTYYSGSNDNTDAYPKVPFSKDPRRVKTSTLTSFANRWAGLYMVWFLMLEVIFKRYFRPYLRKLFAFIVIFNAKFTLNLGMVRK